MKKLGKIILFFINAAIIFSVVNSITLTVCIGSKWYLLACIPLFFVINIFPSFFHLTLKQENCFMDLQFSVALSHRADYLLEWNDPYLCNFTAAWNPLACDRGSLRDDSRGAYGGAWNPDLYRGKRSKDRE